MESVGEKIEFKDFLKLASCGVCGAMKVFSLPNEDDWKKQIKWAWSNQFSAEDFSECFKLLRDRPGRMYPVTPKQIADNLPYLTELRLQGRNKPEQATSAAKEPEYFKYEPNESEIEYQTPLLSDEGRSEALAEMQGYIDNERPKSHIFWMQNCYHPDDWDWLVKELSLEEAA